MERQLMQLARDNLSFHDWMYPSLAFGFLVATLGPSMVFPVCFQLLRPAEFDQ
jgi:hypothetical protein